MKKEKKEVNIVRSSAAEYLTSITANGKSDVNAVYFEESAVIRKFRITAANGKNYNIHRCLRQAIPNRTKEVRTHEQIR